MINKIEELRSLAKEAAIISRSKFDEPMVSLMWMRDGKVALTLYAPSLNLNDGRKNHEYVSESIEALAVRIDDVITKVKSELYKKNQKI
jgi:hypothetical protein